MNKTTSGIILICGLIMVVTQAVEMIHERPILLAIGCLFCVGGFIGLLRAKHTGKTDHQD